MDQTQTSYGNSASNSIMLILLIGSSNSEPILEEESLFGLMVYGLNPELMIYGGLVTGILELSSKFKNHGDLEFTKYWYTDLKNVVMELWMLDSVIMEEITKN